MRVYQEIALALFPEEFAEAGGADRGICPDGGPERVGGVRLVAAAVLAGDPGGAAGGITRPA